MPLAMYVYLVWDSSREEHGEAPELVGVYATKELADEAVGEDDDLSIEEKKVVTF